MEEVLLIAADSGSKSGTPVSSVVLSQVRGAHVTLLSFLWSPTRAQELATTLRDAGAAEIDVVEAASYRGSVIPRARQKYVDFIALWPDTYSKKGKTFKELFTYEGRLSLWWLSELSQKNTLARDSFFVFCCVEVVREVLKTRAFSKALLATYPQELTGVLQQLLTQHGIEAYAERSRRSFLGVDTIPGLLLRRLFDLTRALIGHIQVRIHTKPSQAPTDAGTTLAFQTAYPGEWTVTDDAAFDRYYQDVAEYVSSNSAHQHCYLANFKLVLDHQGSLGKFFRSLPGARRTLKKAPKEMVFLERYASLFRVLVTYCNPWHALRYLQLELFDRAFRRSFTLDGLDYFRVFRRDLCYGFLRELPYNLVLAKEVRSFLKQSHVRTLVLYEEVYSFGRARVYAAKTAGKPVTVIGYQNGTISPLHLVYAYAPGELIRLPEAPDDYVHNMPIPDAMFLQGQGALELLKSSGFPEDRLVLTGSPRFDSLARQIQKLDEPPQLFDTLDGFGADKKVLLIAGTFLPDVTDRIIDMALEVAEGDGNLALLFVPHPALRSSGDAFAQRAAATPNLDWRVWTGTTDQVCRFSDAYLGFGSMTSAEASALGVPIIQPRAPLIDFSPLSDLPGAFVEVGDGQELKLALAKIFEPPENSDTVLKRREQTVSHVFYKLDGKAKERFLQALETLM